MSASQASAKVASGTPSFDFPPVNKEKGFAILDVLASIAKAKGVTVPQIALAWILANPAVTSVIIGARKMAQLDDNLKAVFGGKATVNMFEMTKLVSKHLK